MLIQRRDRRIGQEEVRLIVEDEEKKVVSATKRVIDCEIVQKSPPTEEKMDIEMLLNPLERRK